MISKKKQKTKQKTKTKKKKTHTHTHTHTHTPQYRIFLGFLAKIWKSAYFQRNSTGTFLVSMERADSYLSSRTQIIIIGGFMGKI